MVCYSLLILFTLVWIVNINVEAQEKDTNSEVSDDLPLEILAIGRSAEIGELFDAKNDQFLCFNMFNSSRLPADKIITSENHFSELTFTKSYSYEERFSKLDLSAELKLSVLGGLCSLTGSARYLKDTKRSARTEKASLIQKMRTVKQHISISDHSLKSYINHDVFSQSTATHMVVAIHWGGDMFISVESTKENTSDSTNVEGKLAAQIQLVKGWLSGSAAANANVSENEKLELNNFDIEVFGDVLPKNVPQTFIEALGFMKNMPSLLETSNGGKGKPIKYTLLPINTIKKFWKSTLIAGKLVKTIHEAITIDCVRAFDQIIELEQKINDIVFEIKKNLAYLASEKVVNILAIQIDFLHFKANSTKFFKNLLVEIRSGDIDEEKMNEFLAGIQKVLYKVENDLMSKYQFIEEEIIFIRVLKRQNVTILGKNYSLRKLLMENPHSEIYVLYYNSNFPMSDTKTIKLFRDLIKFNINCGHQVIFSVINYIFSNQDQTDISAKISYYKNELLIIDYLNATNIERFSWKTLPGFDDLNFDEMIFGTFANVSISVKYNYECFSKISSDIEFDYVYEFDTDENDTILFAKNYVFINKFFVRVYIKDNLMIIGEATQIQNEFKVNFYSDSDKIYITGNTAYLNHAIFPIERYELLSNPLNLKYKWIRAEPRVVPFNAVVCGQEFNKTFFCGRTLTDVNGIKSMSPAKISEGIAYCLLNGKDYSTDHNFEYLAYDY